MSITTCYTRAWRPGTRFRKWGGNYAHSSILGSNYTWSIPIVYTGYEQIYWHRKSRKFVKTYVSLLNSFTHGLINVAQCPFPIILICFPSLCSSASWSRDGKFEQAGFPDIKENPRMFSLLTETSRLSQRSKFKLKRLWSRIWSRWFFAAKPHGNTISSEW